MMTGTARRRQGYSTAAVEKFTDRASSDREVCALHLLVPVKVVHGAMPHDLPLLQNISAVAHQPCEMHILLGQQDRQAVALEFDDSVGHLLHDQRRNALRRLLAP